MTDEIFRRDGYLFEFEATVVSAEGCDIELDSTAFYPGGGGQVCDTGTIRGAAVTEVSYKGDRIIHKVPNNDLKEGDIVWCSVDWDRRYDLMMGHTGEHLLFCSLKQQVSDLSINKIFISPDSKYVIVNTDVCWNDINEAVKFANRAIQDNLPITKLIMDRDDPELERVRIKKERISDGDNISVVSIGDIDLSACTGLHVMETGELEMLFVDRKVSAGKDGIAIHFKVGSAAKEASAELANICLQASDAADSKPDDLVKAIANLAAELDTLRNFAKQYTEDRIKELVPKEMCGVNVITGVFPHAERSVLIDAAERFKNKGDVSILVSVNKNSSVIMSSGTERIDCNKILSEVLKEFGGRGGGKADFAQGGVGDPLLAEKLVKNLIKEVGNHLELIK